MPGPSVRRAKLRLVSTGGDPVSGRLPPVRAGALDRGTPAAAATAAPRPRLMDRVRASIRMRHLSRRTEKAYAGWIKRFIFFHQKRHPAEMGAEEVTAFLSS